MDHLEPALKDRYARHAKAYTEHTLLLKRRAADRRVRKYTAMAAANGKHEDELDDEDVTEDAEGLGDETADDAAVYRLNDEQALVATTDFFMPIVDDPYDFGRIAATNAISDIYAMGGKPILALAIVGMPVNVLTPDTIRQILEGGQAVCAAAGIPVAGGHSIDSPEPIYGLVGIGVVHPDQIKTNAGARPGDRLILGKGLGHVHAKVRPHHIALNNYVLQV